MPTSPPPETEAPSEAEEAPIESAPARVPPARALRAPKLSREDEAKLALEHTAISLPVARALSVAFLLTISAVPTLQAISRARRHIAPPTLERGAGLLPDGAEMKKFEEAVQADSPVQDWILPRAQGVLTQLGAGNKKGYIGREGWLVYKPDVDYLLGRSFLAPSTTKARDENGEELASVNSDAIGAIVRFKEQLGARGIKLILLPTPLKPMLEPRALSDRYSKSAPPLQNPSYRKFLEQMTRHQVLVCDPTAALASARDKGQPPFLRADTHWTPEGMKLTAQAVADSIRAADVLSKRPDVGYKRRQVLVSGQGDIAAMLKLAPGQRGFEPQPVTVEPVVAQSGEAWKATRGAEVMLLGDSFTNIYSRAPLGWGSGAGLAEQISFSLQRPLDVIAINAGGASTTRARLRDDLLRGPSASPDRLSRTRVVVWQFAMRDLQSGDWKPLDLPAPRLASASATQVPAPVQAVGPRPTYRVAKPFVLRPTDPVALAQFRVALAKGAAQAEGRGSQVLEGRPGWMFYLPDIYYVSTEGFLQARAVLKSDFAARILPTPAGPDGAPRAPQMFGPPTLDEVQGQLLAKFGLNPQIKALEDFRNQLARRGIALLVVPIPSKTTIYADKLALGVAAPPAPQNPSFSTFGQALQRRGIRFFDPTRALLEQRRHSNTLLFMPGDSHWTFDGAECVAARLSEAIGRAKDLKLSRARVPYTRRAATVRNVTDISSMLPKLPGNAQFIHVEQKVQQVLAPGGKVWGASPSAEILVLGDSFTNIYSRGGYWGRGAGFAEQLSYYLQRPIDRLALDGDGVNGTRLELARGLKQGHDRLAGKKLVIFQVASRYLLSHRWQVIPLPKPKPRPKPRAPRPYDVPPAPQASPTQAPLLAPLAISGTIVDASPVPAANSTPYGEMVMALRLSTVRAVKAGDEKKLSGSDIVVYLWGLRDQKPTEAAQWQKGRRVTLTLRPWSQVEDEFGSYNRSDLEGEAGAGLEEFWGEEPK